MSIFTLYVVFCLILSHSSLNSGDKIACFLSLTVTSLLASRITGRLSAFSNACIIARCAAFVYLSLKSSLPALSCAFIVSFILPSFEITFISLSSSIISVACSCVNVFSSMRVSTHLTSLSFSKVTGSACFIIFLTSCFRGSAISGSSISSTSTSSFTFPLVSSKSFTTSAS